MKRYLITLVTLWAMSLALFAAHGQDFTGDWKGDIQVQQFTIPVVFHIGMGESGLTATLDSPSQGAFGIKANASAKGDKINVAVPEIGASYSATLDGNTLDGTYSQMGFSTPLKLTREMAPAADEDWVNDSLLSVFDNVQLGEVTVTAQRQLIKQEIDRIGYDVQGDADSKTNNVLTMLRKVPMVSVDASDEIRVNGQTNYKIFRNGHPDPSLSRNAKDILKAMPASSVKRIEVITEPGAKYDAEGATVILNIVMADNASVKGVSGMASARADQFGGLGGSLNLTTQLDKVVTSLDYGVHHDSGHGQNVRGKSLSHYNETGADLLSDYTADVDDLTFHYGDLSASWEPDSLNLVSLSLGGYAYNNDVNTAAGILMRDVAGATLYSYGNNDKQQNSHYSVDGRVDYQRSTRLKGETITLSYMLSAWRQTGDDRSIYSDVLNMPVPYSGIFQHGKEHFNEHTVQLDWTRPLGEKHTVETGAKYIYRLNRSHTVMDYLDTDLGEDTRFKHVTQVGAAYVSYSFSSGPWSARAGLRYEYSDLHASYPGGGRDSFSATLNDWVPSASVRYQFNFANSLKLAYSASISRPGISYLNPAVVESPSSRSYGNTDLGSVHYHSMSLTFMHVGPKLTFNLSPSFMYSDNGIGAVKWAEGLVQISTYANTLKATAASLSGFVQWMPHNKTSVMFNGGLTYGLNKSKELALSNGRTNTHFFSQITQYLPWKLQLSGLAGLWGGNITDLYGHMGTMFFHGLSLQRSFLKDDRLTVQCMAQCPFGGKYLGMKTTTDKGDVTGFSRQEQVARKVMLSVSFRFGSLKTQVKKTGKSISNDDLIGDGKQSGNTGGSGMGSMGN